MVEAETMTSPSLTITASPDSQRAVLLQPTVKIREEGELSSPSDDEVVVVVIQISNNAVQCFQMKDVDEALVSCDFHLWCSVVCRTFGNPK